MYTVTEAYNRTLEEADKLGSDYFALPLFLKYFKKEVLDFVGSKAKEIEETQEITDDIVSLIDKKWIPFTNDPDEPEHKFAAKPNDYFSRISINVKYTDGLEARKPIIERFGESNTNSISPFKKAERMYPVIQQFSNYFYVVTGLSLSSLIQPDKLKLIYLKKPTFGSDSNDVVVNLPDQVCELLFARTANSFFVTTGDERAQTDFQINQTYRKDK